MTKSSFDSFIRCYILKWSSYLLHSSQISNLKFQQGGTWHWLNLPLNLGEKIAFLVAITSARISSLSVRERVCTFQQDVVILQLNLSFILTLTVTLLLSKPSAWKREIVAQVWCSRGSLLFYQKNGSSLSKYLVCFSQYSEVREQSFNSYYCFLDLTELSLKHMKHCTSGDHCAFSQSSSNIGSIFV